MVRNHAFCAAESLSGFEHNITIVVNCSIHQTCTHTYNTSILYASGVQHLLIHEPQIYLFRRGDLSPAYNNIFVRRDFFIGDPRLRATESYIIYACIIPYE